jgi:hypothetical protein
MKFGYMKSIDNAWKVPLSTGGIFKIVVDEDRLEIYRIFSGRYIQDKLPLKKDMDYIDSLIVPGATDAVEPEQLYSKIKHMVESITDRYFSQQEEKMEAIKSNMDQSEYKVIKFSDISDIELSAGEEERFPELVLDGDRYIFPSKNFMALQDSDVEKYKEYKNIVDSIREKIARK